MRYFTRRSGYRLRDICIDLVDGYRLYATAYFKLKHCRTDAVGSAAWVATAVVFAGVRDHISRREMLISSLLTMPLGLTEPIFVPEYWDPPTLFNLAESTGFDLESLVFSFAVGGLASVCYERIFPVHRTPMGMTQRHHPRHRWHRVALLSPMATFLVLYRADGFNPIYSVIIAFLVGGLFAGYCRSDLLRKMITSAVLFGLLYLVFFLSLVRVHPGYVSQVWNLQAISGVLLLGVPIEELLFALSLGFLWSSVYEHVT